MLSFRKPSDEDVQRFLAAQGNLGFTYSIVGATVENPPKGYVVDHTRIQLGEGERVYEAAKSALRRWDQLRLGWVEARPAHTPLQKGELVAIVARVVGVWWLNACRITAVVDEAGPHSRFGFAYATLPGHVGVGEERFLIEWNQSDNTVWYDILAFSRPGQFLSKLGYPVVRRTQKRFGRESSAAMRKAVLS